MGINNLMPLIRQKAPGAISDIMIDKLSGKYIALDASQAMYQFLTATQHIKKGGSDEGSTINEIKDSEGNLTAHLIGLFYKTLFFFENGIKPIWVFDGKPPDLKDNVKDLLLFL